MPIELTKVTYSRTIQVAQFEPRKVEIEISFSVNENEDYDTLLQETTTIARDECLALIKKRDRE